MDDWDKRIDDAGNKTDANLSGQMSDLGKLSDEVIAAIAPRPIDKDNLAKIISVVKNATLSNQQKADAINQITGSADVLIGLISRFIV